MIGVLGVIDDVTHRTPIGFAAAGQPVYLLGETRDELGGSEWAHVVHDHLGGRPPRLDLTAERRLAEVLVAGSHDRLVTAAHDVSVGGLGQTLVEMVLLGGVGAQVVLPAGLDPFVALFSESAGRAVVTVPSDSADRLTGLAAAHGVRVAPLGAVGGAALAFDGLFSVQVAELRTASESTLPALYA